MEYLFSHIKCNELRNIFNNPLHLHCNGFHNFGVYNNDKLAILLLDRK